MSHHLRGRALLGFALLLAAADSGSLEAHQPRTTRTAVSYASRPVYPAGAAVWWYAGDIQTGMSLAAKGGTIAFSWSVEAVPNANGVVWQVSRRPFPPFSGAAALNPPDLVKSGRSLTRKGEFKVSFAGLPKLPALKGANYPWYVRVVPTRGRTLTLAGQPSNVIRVYDQKLPPVVADPNFSLGIKSFTEPGVKLKRTGFEFVPYRADHHWPSGCETFKGGNQQDPWEWLSGAVLDLFDWASGAYADMKGFVVQDVVTLLPFVPPPGRVSLEMGSQRGAPESLFPDRRADAGKLVGAVPQDADVVHVQRRSHHPPFGDGKGRVDYQRTIRDQRRHRLHLHHAEAGLVR